MNKKIKILYLVTKGNWGGAQKYTYDLATSLPLTTYDVAVAFGVPAELKERLDTKQIRTISIPELGRDISPLKDFKAFFALLKLFKKERPDIIHLNSSKIGGMGALVGRLAGVKKIIFTAHGWPFWEDRSGGSKWAIKFFSWLTVTLSHKVITLHERDLSAFDRWPFTRGKLVKIYNGIRPQPVLSREEAQTLLKKKYEVIPNQKLIGTIAELHKNKGLPYLIQALRQLPSTISLVIIGEGEERMHLESLIRREHLSERVFLPGFIAEASKLLKAFDTFVLPSTKEGFPFVLLEAGSAQVPIVATTVGGIPEIIENKKEGLLVRPKDSKALATAINATLEDTAQSENITKTFATKIQEKFDFEKVTLPKTLSLYTTR